jgi:UDP-N-acetylglucosamine pyrophosphorylase
MKRWMLAEVLLVAMAVAAFSSVGREARASKQFTPLTKLKCSKCHMNPSGKETETDLTECGKASQMYLNKQIRTNKEWDKIKGFVCPPPKAASAKRTG